MNKQIKREGRLTSGIGRSSSGSDEIDIASTLFASIPSSSERTFGIDLLELDALAVAVGWTSYTVSQSFLKDGTSRSRFFKGT